MKIELKTSYGYYLVINADNVHIEEDIESREYEKDENGKIKNINPKRDINTGYLDEVVSLLDDMIYYREAEYDSSDLVVGLFNKLPTNAVQSLLTKLNEEYNEKI